MELAQDWRLYQKLTRSKKDRSAKLGSGTAALGPQPGKHTVVVSSGESPRVVAVLSAGRGLEEWVGRPFEEFRLHLGENQAPCVLTEPELREALRSAAPSAGLFEQRRELRSALEVVAGKRKGNAPLPGRDRLGAGKTGHFLMEALAGWWCKVLPASYALWIRIEEDSKGVTQAAGVKPAPQDHLLFFKKGELVGCGAPDLTSLGTERIWKDEAVVRHLSEKYLCPIQGLRVRARDWESWMESEKPWKTVRESIQEGNVVFAPERSGLKSLVTLRAWTRI
jgi:hypothetical protein